MRPGQRVLVTGLTGTIGSWVAAEALRRGFSVVAMVRGNDAEMARRRVLAALATAGAGPAADDVQVVLGDLCREGLGLGEDLGGLETGTGDSRRISLICHCAADVRFDDGQAELRERTNVRGTAAVLNLADRLGAALMHLSTAYVAGVRRGLVRESELDLGQSFNNDYERSKYQAEQIVQDWSRGTRCPTIVLRPGIVLGDWTTGRTIHFNALYDFLRFFDRTSAGRGETPFRVQARPDSTMNIVPVDYVARTAWDLAAAEKGGVFHITNPRPVRIDDLSVMFSELFDGVRLRFIETEDFDRLPATRLEQAFSAMAQSYRPYMLSEPVFDRTNIDAALNGSAAPPGIDTGYLRRLLEYARQANWGRDAAPPKAAATSTSGASRQTSFAAAEAFDRYFGEFLAAKRNRRLLPDLHSLSARFRVIPREAPEAGWFVEVRQGVLMAVSRGGAGAECSYLLDAATLLAVASGGLSPQDAFFQRRIEIDGDIETGLRVAFVLASFFKTFPFVMAEQAREANC